MKLTKVQLSWLKNSWEAKAKRPTFWKVFWSVKKAWLLALPVAVGGIWLLNTGSSVNGCVLIAVAWGNIFASIVISIRAVVLWSAFQEVARWDRIEELIRYNESAPIVRK